MSDQATAEILTLAAQAIEAAQEGDGYSSQRWELEEIACAAAIGSKAYDVVSTLIGHVEEIASRVEDLNEAVECAQRELRYYATRKQDAAGRA